MVNHKANIGVVITKFLVITTIVTTAIATPAWAGKARGPGISPLSEEEVVELTFMREEEKLARDVYLEMHRLWYATNVFSRIATSEQRHMDTMKKMLDKYGLYDPALGAEEGEFENDLLQDKYYELITDGSASYVAGLLVGGFIEELDMIDIQEAIDVTEHLDLINAYLHLLEGSKNHLRAFVSALEAQGDTYVPVLISQEYFDAIMMGL